MAKRKPTVRAGMEWESLGKRGPRAYVLSLGGRALASLTWAKRLGTLAVAETDKKRWSFKREGFFSARVTVRAPPSEENLAVFRLGFLSGGALQFADGRRLTWTPPDFWGDAMRWKDARGKTLLSLKPKGLWQRGALVTIDDGKWTQDAALLAALGWYLCVLHQDDSAALAAAVV